MQTKRFERVTKSTASRVAKASISAQETTPGHKFSSWALASSTTSNPLSPMFGPAFISAFSFMINTEPSQPCQSTPSLQITLSYRWQTKALFYSLFKPEQNSRGSEAWAAQLKWWDRPWNTTPQWTLRWTRLWDMSLNKTQQPALILLAKSLPEFPEESTTFLLFAPSYWLCNNLKLFCGFHPYILFVYL